jgi:hypothetical protein
MIRRFVLVRSADVSGISGVGIVAEGVQFSSGRVALTWRHALSSIGIYDNLADLLAIHGHNGATAVEWLDEE